MLTGDCLVGTARARTAVTIAWRLGADAWAPGAREAVDVLARGLEPAGLAGARRAVEDLPHLGDREYALVSERTPQLVRHTLAALQERLPAARDDDEQRSRPPPTSLPTRLTERLNEPLTGRLTGEPSTVTGIRPVAAPRTRADGAHSRPPGFRAVRPPGPPHVVPRMTRHDVRSRVRCARRRVACPPTFPHQDRVRREHRTRALRILREGL